MILETLMAAIRYLTAVLIPFPLILMIAAASILNSLARMTPCEVFKVAFIRITILPLRNNLGRCCE